MISVVGLKSEIVCGTRGGGQPNTKVILSNTITRSSSNKM